MNAVPVTEVKARFSSYIRKTRKSPVVVTKNGKPVVVMLHIRNEDELERILLANSPRFQAMLDAAEQRITETGGIGHEELWNMVESEFSAAETR